MDAFKRLFWVWSIKNSTKQAKQDLNSTRRAFKRLRFDDFHFLCKRMNILNNYHYFNLITFENGRKVIFHFENDLFRQMRVTLGICS